jgi:hypothetical protein
MGRRNSRPSYLEELLQKQSEKRNQCKKHKPGIRKRLEPKEWVIQFAPPPAPGQIGFDFDIDSNEEEKGVE